MTIAKIKYIHPATPGYTHKPQLDFLNLPIIGNEVSKIHFISGRSGGKTAAVVMLVFKTCIDEPGTMGLVLAPTYKMLQRSFMREWIEVIPANLYRYNQSKDTVTLINGSMFYIATRSIDSPARGKELTRGNTVNWVVDDEAALGFDAEAYTNTLLTVRRKGKRRFYAFTTTPRMNAYYDLVHSDGHSAIYSTSRDNPFNPPGFIDDAAGQMTKQQADREIEGKWVHLEGLVWPDWSWDPWPKGNVYEYRFQPGRPWYLFLDLGSATGAFVVCQLVSTTGMGHGVPGSDIWVATTELLPSDDGSAARAFGRLKALYGTPHMVIGGADLKTRASTDGRRATFFVREVWGGGVQVKDVVGWMADKHIQHDSLSRVICDSEGRRFCVASNFESLGQSGKARRGIQQMVDQDVWPDSAGKSRSNYLAKEGRLEHIRDALMYGAVGIMNPPRFVPDRRMLV